MIALLWQWNIASECLKRRASFFLRTLLCCWDMSCATLTGYLLLCFCPTFFVFAGFSAAVLLWTCLEESCLTPSASFTSIFQSVMWLYFQCELHHLSKQQSCAAAGFFPGIRFMPLWLENMLPSRPVSLAGVWLTAHKSAPHVQLSAVGKGWNAVSGLGIRRM